MDCKYINMFKAHIFYMTMEVIEEGILGVYKVIVACGISDGSTTLLRFILTDRRPVGMWLLITWNISYLELGYTPFCATNKQHFLKRVEWVQVR